MKVKIENIKDLRSELSRLRIQRAEYENDLQQISDQIQDKLRTPVKIINKITDLFSSLLGINKNNIAGDEEKDWVSRLFSVGLPVFLNRFIFRRSGFLMKSLVALISQKAATNLNMNSVSGLIDKVSDWIKSSKPRRRKRGPVLHDYGIPPDSETF